MLIGRSSEPGVTQEEREGIIDEAADSEGRKRIVLAREPIQDDLAAVLADRRSTKTYSSGQIALSQVADLLGAVAATTDGRRPYASAHALYPVELSVAARAVDGLEPAIYRYDASRHSLVTTVLGDYSGSLAAATIDGDWLAACPLVLMFSADLASLETHFAEQAPGRGTGFAWMEVGLLSQSLYLWAAARRLGTCFIGGLRDSEVPHLSRRLAPEGQTILGLQPVGIP